MLLRGDAQAAAEFAGRVSGPAPEGAAEMAGVGVAEAGYAGLRRQPRRERVVADFPRGIFQDKTWSRNGSRAWCYAIAAFVSCVARNG
jgi:hypothetical protein